MDTPASLIFAQHLIDPEICIRCNTCEATCPVKAITHDARNYVVDADKCQFCKSCLLPCPTGAIDNWRTVSRLDQYSVASQLGWDSLPTESSPELLIGQTDMLGAVANAPAIQVASPVDGGALSDSTIAGTAYGATLPPWSAAHPYTLLYGPQAAERSITATVVGNVRVTAIGHDYDTHHIMLDFGPLPFPVLEGQSLGVLPPGMDASGRPHHARQYSIASPRNGERAGYNNVSLAVKRVLEDHGGKPLRGVASNYLCDLVVGDKVQVIGPFGASFLMPNHPGSNIVMICTGTGSAPMRAMTEWRRRQRNAGKVIAGKLMLFFGARTQEELPYFGPLQNLPKDFIDINFAFSRMPGQGKRYVQDVMRERATDLASLLSDANSYFYVCGLKSMEDGVIQALRDVAQQQGLSWQRVGEALKREGRLHLETY
jgi:benzoyl-CoA 2,3-dioxygenase component A